MTAHEVINKNVYGAFDLTKVDERYQELVNMDLRSQQQNMVSSLQGLQNTILTVQNSLSAEQQTYFTERVDKESGRVGVTSVKPDDGTEQIENTQSDEAEVKPLSPPAKFKWIDVKYLFLGLLAGLFLGCVYYAMIYILNSKLRSVNDLSMGYGLHVFGTYKKVVTGEQKRFGKGIDECLEHVFRKDVCVLGETENVKRICTEMEIAVARNGWKNVHLTGSADSEEACALVQTLKKKLASKEVKVTCGKSVIFDTESLESLMDADAVILVEQLEKSKYSHLEGELNICKQYQVPVMGAVVVEL